MATPLLLLRPGASRDTNGPVTPTVNGNVTVVAGQHADAWSMNGGYLTLPAAGRIAYAAGTLLMRLRFDPTQAFTTHFCFGTNAGGSNNEINMYHMTDGAMLTRMGQNTVSMGTVQGQGEWIAAGSRWNASEIAYYHNGVRRNGSARVGLTATPSGNMGIGSLANGFQPMRGFVESVLICANDEEPEEILRIATMDAAWTWDNVTAPSVDRNTWRGIIDVNTVLPRIGSRGRLV